MKTYFDLHGITAVVTGAGQGIGCAIVRSLVNSGASIIAIDRQRSSFALLEQMDGDITLQGYLTGTGLPSSIDQALSDHLTGVDVLGILRLSRWAVSHMIRRNCGAIVDTSVFELVGAAKSAVSSASKAAVIGLTRQMATNFGPNNIRVDAVAPGLIETPLAREVLDERRQIIMVNQSPLRRMGKLEDVACVVRFLASKALSFITGQTLHVDGGWALRRYLLEHKITRT